MAIEIYGKRTGKENSPDYLEIARLDKNIDAMRDAVVQAKCEKILALQRITSKA